MRNAIESSFRLRNRLDMAMGLARSDWRDSTAQTFENRYYEPLARRLAAYIHAAENLLEAIEDAERLG
ncbi:hypothetical protein [Brevundimonas sp.]|uniref:hypothetical protein n=1 Tax=Brevundimonas sp. TaxID=1871086 RepID=UPI002EDB77F6